MVVEKLRRRLLCRQGLHIVRRASYGPALCGRLRLRRSHAMPCREGQILQHDRMSDLQQHYCQSTWGYHGEEGEEAKRSGTWCRWRSDGVRHARPSRTVCSRKMECDWLHHWLGFI